MGVAVAKSQCFNDKKASEWMDAVPFVDVQIWKIIAPSEMVRDAAEPAWRILVLNLRQVSSLPINGTRKVALGCRMRQIALYTGLPIYSEHSMNAQAGSLFHGQLPTMP